MGNKVYIEFSYFDLEYILDDYEDDAENICNIDFVSVEELDDGNVIKSHKYCKDKPQPIETTNTVVIKYVIGLIYFSGVG